MKHRTEKFDLHVCGTCINWLVNDDDSSLDLLPTMEAEARRVARDTVIDDATPIDGWVEWLIDTDDLDLHFRWYGCDLCDGAADDLADIAAVVHYPAPVALPGA
jgi:hypothetical protein